MCYSPGLSSLLTTNHALVQALPVAYGLQAITSSIDALLLIDP